jgi:hypothetical protein
MLPEAFSKLRMSGEEWTSSRGQEKRESHKDFWEIRLSSSVPRSDSSAAFYCLPYAHSTRKSPDGHILPSQTLRPSFARGNSATFPALIRLRPVRLASFDVGETKMVCDVCATKLAMRVLNAEYRTIPYSYQSLTYGRAYGYHHGALRVVRCLLLLHECTDD